MFCTSCIHSLIKRFKKICSSHVLWLSASRKLRLRWLHALFSSRRPGFEPNSFTSFFEYLKFYPVVVIPVKLYNYSCIYQRHTILATIENTLQYTHTSEQTRMMELLNIYPRLSLTVHYRCRYRVHLKWI
jgi:hypothetical protein